MALVNTSLELSQVTSIQLSTGANFTIPVMPELPLFIHDTEGYNLTVRFTPSDTGMYNDELVVAIRDIEIRSRVSGRGVKSSTSVHEVPALLPAMQELYPNPAGEEATLHYTLARTERVRLALFNTMGQEVLSLFDGMQVQGEHTVRMHTGNVPPGMYVCRLSSGNTTVSSRLIIAR